MNSTSLKSISQPEHQCSSLASCACSQKQQMVSPPVITAAEPHLGVLISEDLQSLGFENPLISNNRKNGIIHSLSEKEKI